MNSIFHNSWDSFFRFPFGAVECNKNVLIRIKLPYDKIKTVKLVVFNDHNKNYYSMELESRTDCVSIFKYILKTSSNPDLLFYYFQISIDNKIIFYGNNSEMTGGIGKIYSRFPSPYQITVFKENYSTPYWFKNTIIYQIFVDRFFNGNDNNSISNPKENSFIYGSWYDKPMYIRNSKNNNIERWDFFGGNLKGIIKKLDYLKDLGISTIYLNPIFESRSNHKYDTANYKKIDSMFGNEAILKELIHKASLKNINIILDGVFSHTGSDSIYFNKFNSYNSIGACQSKSSKYYPWYNFKNYPDEYDCWWGVSDLPNVDELNKTYLNYIIEDDDSVIKHWMKLGIKGWRLDVADELPDEFIKKLKAASNSFDKDSIVLGEVWEDASNKVSYNKRREYFSGYELDSVTNYLMRNNILDFLRNNIDSLTLRNRFMSLYENYPIHNFYSMVNIIGSHDVERIYSVINSIALKNYADKFNDKSIDIPFRLLKIITLIQFTFPGIPLLYYGDEAGSEGGNDPSNRATYPWKRENKIILNWYKKLIHIRNNIASLKTGAFKQINFGYNIYGYFRYILHGKDEFNIPTESSICLILVNKSPYDTYNFTINTSDYIKEASLNRLTNIFNKNDEISLISDTLNISIKPLDIKLYIGI
ncbi:glycoside hydrolase family 13 protein [Clostridium fermenticellae]|uniref:Glycoside hydrolase family 13 protein n=1 Tax=Clostridium fermenticellae TaxID=2068654 RepID=A0A386H3C1_9CLOT|nr:glycoside hydrolase family 13 protein [Clostridium fermenticellae]AYD40166.1 glycoside hydrolase family 13 protein [Clostridium fermenticellae]